MQWKSVLERTKATNVWSVNEQRHQAEAEGNSRDLEPGVTSEYTVPWRLTIWHPCPDFKYCLPVWGPDACKVSSILQPRGQKHKDTRKQHQKEENSQWSYFVKLHLPSLGLLGKRDNSVSSVLKPQLLAVNCICKLVQSLRGATWQYISILNAHTLWMIILLIRISPADIFTWGSKKCI